MDRRDIAFASLRDRVYHAALTHDLRVLLDERALAEARELTAATDPGTDIHAARTLGWFRWLRYLAVPGQAASQDLSAALGLLQPVFERNPYAVPEPLQVWFLQTEAGSYASPRQPGPAGRPGPDRRRGVERLPAFHAAVRSTVGAAPPNQPDRVRFLLDVALMLRRIAGLGADDAVLAEAAEVTIAALGPGPATLPQQAGLRLPATPQALLEPIEDQVAARAVESSRRAAPPWTRVAGGRA